MRQSFTPLYPLNQIPLNDKTEQALKAAFSEVFAAQLGEKMRDLLHYGSPHLARDALLTKLILTEGLDLPATPVDLGFLQYLLKSWRVKNPKRGFHFLTTYLQLLYPNNFRLTQLWQAKNQPYPQGLSEQGTEATHWLTSRVKLEITAPNETGETLLRYKPTFEAVIGARFLLQLELLRQIGAAPMSLNFACGAVISQVVSFNGELKRR